MVVVPALLWLLLLTGVFADLTDGPFARADGCVPVDASPIRPMGSGLADRHRMGAARLDAVASSAGE